MCGGLPQPRGHFLHDRVGDHLGGGNRRRHREGVVHRPGIAIRLIEPLEVLDRRIDVAMRVTPAPPRPGCLSVGFNRRPRGHLEDAYEDANSGEAFWRMPCGTHDPPSHGRAAASRRARLTLSSRCRPCHLENAGLRQLIDHSSAVMTARCSTTRLLWFVFVES